MKLMLHLTKFGLTAAVSANCQASSWQLASGEIFPIKTKDSGDKLDEVAGQPKQKTQATNLTLTCCKLPTSLPLSRNSAYSWRNVKLSAKFHWLDTAGKGRELRFPILASRYFCFWATDSLSVWVLVSTFGLGQIQLVDPKLAALLSKKVKLFILFRFSLSLSLSLLHSFAWDRQCQPVEQTQRKLWAFSLLVMLLWLRSHALKENKTHSRTRGRSC